MRPLAWKTYHPATEEDEYLALITCLPLKRYVMIPRFFRMTRDIQGQLDQSRGLMGYSLWAQITAKRFWTLSVWEDDDALMEFVMAPPHVNVMKALQSHMGQQGFLRWKIDPAAVPLTWEHAVERFRSEHPR